MNVRSDTVVSLNFRAFTERRGSLSTENEGVITAKREKRVKVTYCVEEHAGSAHPTPSIRDCTIKAQLLSQLQLGSELFCGGLRWVEFVGSRRRKKLARRAPVSSGPLTLVGGHWCLCHLCFDAGSFLPDRLDYPVQQWQRAHLQLQNSRHCLASRRRCRKIYLSA